MARAFDRNSQSPLMTCTGSRLPSWADFAIFSYEPAQHIRVLVIDADVLISAELADFGTSHKTARSRKSLIFIYIFF